MSTVQLTPTSVGISIDFMRRKAPELARDIVCQLDGAANLAAGYGLSSFQWDVLKVWPAFKQMVQEANEELGGSAGTIERARRKAALAVAEVGVQDMATIMGDPKVPSRDRINAFSELKDIAGMGTKQQMAAAVGGGAAVGFGPLIQIVMPNGASLAIGEADIDHTRLPPPIEGEAVRIDNGDDA